MMIASSLDFIMRHGTQSARLQSAQSLYRNHRSAAVLKGDARKPADHGGCRRMDGDESVEQALVRAWGDVPPETVVWAEAVRAALHGRVLDFEPTDARAGGRLAGALWGLTARMR